MALLLRNGEIKELSWQSCSLFHSSEEVLIRMSLLTILSSVFAGLMNPSWLNWQKAGLYFCLSIRHPPAISMLSNKINHYFLPLHTQLRKEDFKKSNKSAIFLWSSCLFVMIRKLKLLNLCLPSAGKKHFCETLPHLFLSRVALGGDITHVRPTF